MGGLTGGSVIVSLDYNWTKIGRAENEFDRCFETLSNTLLTSISGRKS